MRISGSYKLKKWDETTYGMIESGKKTTKVSAQFFFTGDIEGEADFQYLMFYKGFDPKDMHKTLAQYGGLIRITGEVKGKPGTFALADEGTFEAGTARSTLGIIPGSGTGQLSRINGAGSYTADQKNWTWEMDVTF
jgi:hypothetical protein